MNRKMQQSRVYEQLKWKENDSKNFGARITEFGAMVG
jgi:hypothetical protein